MKFENMLAQFLDGSDDRLGIMCICFVRDARLKTVHHCAVQRLVARCRSTRDVNQHDVWHLVHDLLSGFDLDFGRRDVQ